MTQNKRPKFNAQIAEEAAEWFVDFRLDNIDATGRRDFDTWIRSSPEHLRAYLETAAIWNEGSSLSAHRDLDSDALIALAHTVGNVVPLELDPSRTARETETGRLPAEESAKAPLQGSPGQAPNGRNAPHFLGRSVPPKDTHEVDGDRLARGRDPRSGRRVRLFAVAASILLVTVALATYVLAPRGVYATAVGERRILTLEDGSSVELNSRSRIRVRFAQNQRDVELLEGQVLFHVAKDPHRPFIVHSDSVRIRAVGTQFDVNRKTTGTTVTVVEGRVAVYRDGTSEPGTSITPSQVNTKESARVRPLTGGRGAPTNNPGTPVRGTGSAVARPSLSAIPGRDPNGSGQDAGSAAVFLSAGDQITLSDQSPPGKPEHITPSAATAWTQGQLVLDAASLADVAEEFNRYSSRRLIAEDHGARPLQLSGVFSTDPGFLLHYLHQRDDITVQESPTEVRIIRHD